VRKDERRLGANAKCQKGIPKDGLPKDGLPKDGLPKNGLPKNGLPKNRLQGSIQLLVGYAATYIGISNQSQN
jgi:hypothetical protein